LNGKIILDLCGGKPMKLPLTQAERDAKRDTTLVRISRALLAIMRGEAEKKGDTVRHLMESVLRKQFKEKRK